MTGQAQSINGRLRLSKSKIAAFEHCPRRLWLQTYRCDAAQFSPQTLARFKFGHDVGARARFAVSGGILVETGMDMEAALLKTRDLILCAKPKPIFEATFQYEDVLVHVDVLQPDGAGGWHAIEVKASAKVKPYQIADIATQVWVMRGCGIRVTKAIIRHLAPPFSWGRPDIAAIRFADADVSNTIRHYLARRAKVVAKARQAMGGEEITRAPGPYCERPFACEFINHCRKARDYPLFAITGI